MKRILIVCLLGMGLLLPATKSTAKEFFSKRIIDVTLEGEMLGITSDASTGTLTHMEIVNTSHQTVLSQDITGYSASIDVSGLPGGIYSVHVYTTLTNYKETIGL